MGVVEIPLGEIAPSTFNPRKTFDQAKLEELAQSIRTHGVLQPVLVRPQNNGATPAYDLVLGERRVRAAQLAGLEAVPAVVRVMEDVEVVEAQVIENDQREGVSPLEEADGYQLLMERFGRSVEEIAAKTGRSKAYVYARLKLTNLGKKGREAFAAGLLTPATALYVARLPHDLQGAAVERLQPYHGRDDGDPVPMSARDAAAVIREHFMRVLKGAPFDTADPDLVKKAGACGACPKRTGNQPDLFGEVDSADVCTDPACFRKKADAAWKPQAEKERAKGHTVIDGKAAKEVTQETWGGTSLRYNAGLRSLDDKEYVGGKTVTLRSLMPKGEGAPSITVVRAEDGTVIRAIERKAAEKLLRALRPKKAKEKRTSNARAAAEENRRHEEIAEVVLARARAEIVTLVETGGVPNLWRLLIAAATNMVSFDCQGDVLRRRRPGTKSVADSDLALQALAAELDEAQCRGLLAELLLGDMGDWRGEEEVRKDFAAWGVDLAAIEEEVAAELAPAPAEPKKAARKKRAKAEAVQG